MKTTDLPTLIPYLTSHFKGLDNISIALSGSLSRGDYRCDDTGTVTSDMDLFPIVSTPEEAATARATLIPMLQEIANHYDTHVTASITTSERFLSTNHSQYLYDMCEGSLFHDPLGFSSPGKTERPKTDRMPWLIQPVTYYLAKATSSNPELNKAKSTRALGFAQAHAHINHLRPSLEEAIHQLAAPTSATLLPSTIAYLASPTDEDIYPRVRDLAYLENQGLPFEVAALSIKPAKDNS